MYKRQIVQAFQPHLAPAVADERGIGRVTHRAEQERSPPEVCPERRAAHVVHIVAITVVGRADRDDRLQCRWAAGGDLQCVEPSPGNPHHADGATAPGLRRQPRDHLERVVLFLLSVFIGQQAIRFAAAPDIDTDGGIAVARKIGMHQRVALIRAGSLAVRQVLEDRRNRIPHAVRRQPDTRGQVRSITQRNQRVLDFAYLAGKPCDDQVRTPLRPAADMSL